ncbi:MAG: hypothetical protein QMC93_00970 [Patescibacteria group bacterium]|nr:hypothetical protein [Patescibacteria group bacterium]
MKEALTIKELAELAGARGWKLRQKEISFLKKLEERKCAGAIAMCVDKERLTEREFHKEIGRALWSYNLGVKYKEDKV